MNSSMITRRFVQLPGCVMRGPSPTVCSTTQEDLPVTTLRPLAELLFNFFSVYATNPECLPCLHTTGFFIYLPQQSLPGPFVSPLVIMSPDIPSAMAYKESQTSLHMFNMVVVVMPNDIVTVMPLSRRATMANFFAAPRH